MIEDVSPSVALKSPIPDSHKEERRIFIFLKHTRRRKTILGLESHEFWWMSQNHKVFIILLPGPLLRIIYAIDNPVTSLQYISLTPMMCLVSLWAEKACFLLLVKVVNFLYSGFFPMIYLHMQASLTLCIPMWDLRLRELAPLC